MRLIRYGLFALALGLLLMREAHAQIAAPGTGEMPATESFLERHIDLHGYMRLRFDLLENLDLNHGPTPSTGRPLFAVPTSGSSAPLTSANLRLRLDPVIRVGWGVSLHARVDLLDNIVLGSTPSGLPSSTWVPMSGASASQVPPVAGSNAAVDSLQVKRAWAQVILPIGILAAGRMGAMMDWGTGFFINSGNCIECDQGDVGDRVSLTLPLLGHLIGLAFDFGASGPTSDALIGDPQPFDLDPADNVRSFALMITNWEAPRVVERYRRAGRTVLQYGLVTSVRTQEKDIPAYYMTGDLERTYSHREVVHRGLLALMMDLWIGLRRGGWTVDLEAAGIFSRIDDASLLPGTELLRAVTARQFGGVLRAQYRWPRLELELELGLASGDSAPGFGVRAPRDQLSSRQGDLDGPQLAIPGDTTINNFRFNPDYHVDQILWRRIIGTVTDAFYARPTARWRLLESLRLEGAVIASTALESASTPSGDAPVGVELDLTLGYQLERAFEARLTYAVLFPLSGLNNTRLGLDAEPAQLLHLLLAFVL